MTRRTWYAAAIEKTPGTPASAPTLYLPYSGVIKKDRKAEYSTEERGTRDTNFSVQYTTRKASAEFKGKYYNDTAPYLIMGAMGTDSVTSLGDTSSSSSSSSGGNNNSSSSSGSSSSNSSSNSSPSAYKHIFGISDTLPSFTVFKSYDAQLYQCSLSYVEKFSIKITAEGKLIEFDATTQSQYPQKFTGTPPTPSYSTVKAFAGYAPTLTLNGNTTSDISELTFNFQQKLTPWFAISGSPDMTAMYPGERTASLDFTARFDKTDINDLFDNTQDFSLGLDVKGEAITSSINQQLNMGFPVVNFDSIEWDLSQDNVLIKAKATIRPSATNQLFNCFVVNTVPSYVN